MTDEQRDLYNAVYTEIIAGSVLFPKTEEDYAWNRANQRAASIAKRYAEGRGLFQIGTEQERKNA
jgi:hypothetical protein